MFFPGGAVREGVTALNLTRVRAAEASGSKKGRKREVADVAENVAAGVSRG